MEGLVSKKAITQSHSILLPSCCLCVTSEPLESSGKVIHEYANFYIHDANVLLL